MSYKPLQHLPKGERNASSPVVSDVFSLNGAVKSLDVGVVVGPAEVAMSGLYDVVSFVY